MWDVGDVGCWRCEILEMWDIGDVGCSGCGMFGIWDFGDVGCSGFGMFGMWDVRDVESLLGCGILIYKMPHSAWKYQLLVYLLQIGCLALH